MSARRLGGGLVTSTEVFDGSPGGSPSTWSGVLAGGRGSARAVLGGLMIAQSPDAIWWTRLTSIASDRVEGNAVHLCQTVEAGRRVPPLRATRQEDRRGFAFLTATFLRFQILHPCSGTASGSGRRGSRAATQSLDSEGRSYAAPRETGALLLSDTGREARATPTSSPRVGRPVPRAPAHHSPVSDFSRLRANSTRSLMQFSASSRSMTSLGVCM